MDNPEFRALVRSYARRHALTLPNTPIHNRNKIIDYLIKAWTGSCCAPPYYDLNRRIICGQNITLQTKYATVARARYDISANLWLCEICYYRKYNITFKCVPTIKDAKKIYEETGKRYQDSGYNNKSQKRKIRQIYDPQKSNYNLIRTCKGSWVFYRCPHCDFYSIARLYQGWPSHHCRSKSRGIIALDKNDDGWK